ncbi:hypothetical protein Q3G72_017850 [Acer saccharum]|nr:hypothetical protein Q3G72_017850 [Acer saccharum]
MDHHNDQYCAGGEHHNKPSDEEAIACLEEIKKSIEAKMALRQSNLNPERPDSGFLRTLDSSIKRNTAIIKKLKQLNEVQREGLMDELRSANLSKFVSEAVTAICDAKLRSSDIQAAAQICSLLHQRYKDFSPCLIQGLLKVFLLGKSGDDLDVDKNGHEEVQHSETPLGTLFCCFAQQGRIFLGLPLSGQEIYEEFFKGLNITVDQKKIFKKAFHIYYDAVQELLQSEHTSLRQMEHENAKILNAKGELSEENASSHEKLRKSYDLIFDYLVQSFFSWIMIQFWKLDRFLIHFQRYILSKGVLPLDVEFDLRDLFMDLRHNMTRYSSIEEVNAALIDLEEHERNVSTEKAHSDKYSDTEKSSGQTTTNSISSNGKNGVCGTEENGGVHEDSDSDSGSDTIDQEGHDEEGLDEENHDEGDNEDDDDDDERGGACF